jgi:hypothetical protein
MDELEKQFKKEAYEVCNSKVFDGFKKNHPEMYLAAVNTFRNVNNKQINNKLLTMIKPNITKLSLRNGSDKVYIMCGCFMLRGKKVLLLELSETIGTYFLEDSNIVKKLMDYKIGTKVRLKKEDEKINFVLPHEKLGGLFD